MLRSFGISLLLLGLLASGVDGFRQRERIRVTSPSTIEATDIAATEDVHLANYGTGIPPK